MCWACRADGGRARCSAGVLQCMAYVVRCALHAARSGAYVSTRLRSFGRGETRSGAQCSTAARSRRVGARCRCARRLLCVGGRAGGRSHAARHIELKPRSGPVLPRCMRCPCFVRDVRLHRCGCCMLHRGAWHVGHGARRISARRIGAGCIGASATRRPPAHTVVGCVARSAARVRCSTGRRAGCAVAERRCDALVHRATAACSPWPRAPRCSTPWRYPAPEQGCVRGGAAMRGRPMCV
jgi:hypothetical protein